MSLPPVRRIVLFVVAVVVAAVCVRLGFWQLARLDERRTMNASIEAGLAAPPAPVDRLLDDASDPEELAYRRVTTTGTYDAEKELVLYGRSLEGSPGDHVLTPLVTDGGHVILVDRGWIPYEPNREPPLGPPIAPPPGPVRIEGVFLPAEEGNAFSGDPSARLVRSVNVGEIDATLDDLALAPAYLLLQDQAPGQADDLPVPAPIPETSEGPHLSYAIQWFSFASIALVGYGVLARRDRREARSRPERPEEG